MFVNIYPDEFYHIEKTSDPFYKSNPPGTPDVHRLIKGKKAFQSPVLARKREPKKLVLADWKRYRRWSTEDDNKLTKLIEAGFEIYLWNNKRNKIEPYKKQNLSRLLHGHIERPDLHPNLQEKAAADINVSKDKVLVLDSYKIDCLLEEDFNLPHIIDTKYFWGIERAKQLEGYLKSMTPPPSRFVYDYGECQEENIKHYEEFKAFAESSLSCPIVKDLRKIRHIEETLLDALLTPPLDQHVPYIEEIDLSGDYTSPQKCAELLQNIAKLKSMTLSCRKNTKIILEAYLKNPKNLEHLEKVDFFFSDISFDQLSTLLQNSPGLKSLYLTMCENLINIPEVFLGDLEVLNLGDCFVPYSNLLNFLKNTPRLKALNLGGWENLNSHLAELCSVNLEYLEEINLSNSEVLFESLFVLAKKLPKLRILTLNTCKNLSEHFEGFSEDFSDLVEITLNNSSISSDNLFHLLQHTPKLEVLNLRSCKNLSQYSEIFPGRLEHLEVINLQESSISPDTLFKLLQYTPKLRWLNLNSCNNLNLYSELLPGSLNHLKEINLEESSISPDILFKLLYQAPKLKILTLTECKNLDTHSEIFPGNLGKLEEINLEKSSISSSNLIRLLQSSPRD